MFRKRKVVKPPSRVMAVTVPAYTPRMLVESENPELIERLAARLRGEHVVVFPVKSMPDKR